MRHFGRNSGTCAGGAGGNYAAANRGPGYNAHEQLAFEQQKYEQQQARRVPENRSFSPYQQGGPTSWEGMYDEVPQPNIPTGPQGRGGAGGGMGRGGNQNTIPNRQINTQLLKGMYRVPLKKRVYDNQIGYSNFMSN